MGECRCYAAVLISCHLFHSFDEILSEIRHSCSYGCISRGKVVLLRVNNVSLLGF